MALSGIQAPKSDWTSSNLPETWRKFRQHAQLIFNGPLKEKDEDVLCTYLLIWVGQNGRDIYTTWNLSDEDGNKLKSYYDGFDKYVQPKANQVFARYKFNNIVQNTSSFDEFVTRFKLAVKYCSYNEPNADEMIRDRIVFGVSSQKERDKLINEGKELTIDKAIQVGQSYEYSQQQLNTMKTESSPGQAVTAPVHAVSKGNNSHGKYGHKHSVRQQSDRRHDNTHKYRDKQYKGHDDKQDNRSCDNCGRQHRKSETCPVKGRQCMKCKKWNHFAVKCRSVNVNEVRLDHVDDDGSESSDFFVDTITCSTNKNVSDEAFTSIEVGPTATPVTFNTSSQVNIIPSVVFHKICPAGLTLSKPDKHLSSFSGTPIKTGHCNLKCQYKGHYVTADFYIAEKTATPILGLKSCLDLELIQLVYAVNRDKPPGITVNKPETQLDKAKVLNEFSDIF